MLARGASPATTAPPLPAAKPCRVLPVVGQQRGARQHSCCPLLRSAAAPRPWLCARGGGTPQVSPSAASRRPLPPVPHANAPARDPPVLSEAENGSDPQLSSILRSVNRNADEFVPDFSSALKDNKVTPQILLRYLELESNALVRPVWGLQGFRERLMGDPSFPVKVGIECGIGICTKLTAEHTKRGPSFWPEIDFVLANVIMALIADFMLTWLPAPTLSYEPKQQGSRVPLADFFANCPDNAFQCVAPNTEPYRLSQRLGAVARNGSTLLLVGFCASVMGVGLTNALVAARHVVDPSWSAPNQAQDVLSTSLAYGVYMAVSSNLRYQVIAGVIEERGIEVFFKDNPRLCAALSLVVRTLNTFVGSLLWVDFIKLLGMQTSGVGE